MFRSIVFGALFLVLFSASTVYADSMTVTVALDGSSAESFGPDPSAGITTTLSLSPYGGTLDGQPAEFICVNFNEPIPSAGSWTANVTALGNAANDYSSTELGQEMPYLEMAVLSTDLTNAVANEATEPNPFVMIAQDQFAIWAVTSGLHSPDPYGTNLSLISAAASQVAGFNSDGWEILTPAVPGTGQEFLVKTPEPSSLLMFSIGLLGLTMVWGKRWRAC